MVKREIGIWKRAAYQVWQRGQNKVWRSRKRLRNPGISVDRDISAPLFFIFIASVLGNIFREAKNFGPSPTRPSVNIIFLGNTREHRVSIWFGNARLIQTSKPGESTDLHHAPNQPLPELPLSRQFLQHFHRQIRDALAGAGLGVAVVTSPNLVATQLVPLQIWQVANPIVGQLGNVGVTER
jgi:hypothetical protein